MENHSEKLWDYDAVEPGQSGPPTVVSITKEDISWYALATQNPSSQFKPNGTCQEWPSVAMPTMVLTYSPLLREEIAKANGFVALEWSRTARRQTPFAKCEIRWSRGVLAGNTITSTRRVLEKYVRRGSRFVTFRVEATNQNGDEVAQYDYTCIFDYDESRKDAPQETRETEASSPDTVRERYSWEAVRDVGDQLAPLNIQASRENINEKAAFRLAGKHDPNNLRPPEHVRRPSHLRWGRHVLRGPDAPEVVHHGVFLRWPPVAPGDRAISARRHRDLSR